MRYGMLLVPLILCSLTPIPAYGQATDLECNNCVHASDMAARAVTTNKIGNSAVVTDKIAAGAVTTNKIGNGSVSRSKLRAGAVSTGKIQNGAVTAEKLDAASVGGGLALDATTIRVADGFVSVSANASYPRNSLNETDQGGAAGRIGRYQTSGTEMEYLVAHVSLPHGARIVSLTYNVIDGYPDGDSRCSLWRDDGQIGPGLTSQGFSGTVQTISSPPLDSVVDNSQYSYWIYMGIHGQAGEMLEPINAIVGYVYD